MYQQDLLNIRWAGLAGCWLLLLGAAWGPLLGAGGWRLGAVWLVVVVVARCWLGWLGWLGWLLVARWQAACAIRWLAPPGCRRQLRQADAGAPAPLATTLRRPVRP